MEKIVRWLSYLPVSPAAQDTMRRLLLSAVSVTLLGSVVASVRAAILPTDLAVISVESANPGPSVEKSLCLTFSIVKEVATQCGAVRIVHPLPSVRTYNKVRTPTLIYYSDQAADWAIVNADITLASGVSAPTSVRTTLYERTSGGGETQIAQRTDAGSYWSSGGQRVALTWPSLTGSSRVLPYRIKVEFLVSGTWTSAASPVDGELALVRRELARGWHVAGVEALYAGFGESWLWVGGDGSTRVYRKTSRTTSGGDSVYEVASTERINRPDSLLIRSSGVIVRTAPGGARTEFESGRHVRTITRLNDTTLFTYSSGRLSTITVPPTNAGLTYTFNYGGSGNSQLTSVSSPGPVSSGTPRTTSISYPSSTSSAISGITDPTSTSVSFTHTSWQGVATRTDRRGTITKFVHESGAWTLAKDTTTVVGPSYSFVVHTFQNAQSRAIASSTPVAIGTAIKTSHTNVNSPSATEHFWLNRVGAIDSLENYVGAKTRLRRDASYPGRVTKMIKANGMTDSAAYDTRGNLASTTAFAPYGGGNATTTYSYDGKWDVVTKVKRPEGDSTVVSVDSTNGNILWAQTGPTASRVNFSYASSPADCRLRYRASSDPDVSARDSVIYSALCNTATIISRRGIRSMRTQDRLGRDIASYEGVRGWIGSMVATIATTYSYDAVDRLVTTSTYGEATSYTLQNGTSVSVPDDQLTVTNYYDNESNVIEVRRNAGKSTETNQGNVSAYYRYDALGRVVVEKQPGSDSVRYLLRQDGAPIHRISAYGDTVYTWYDALGQLLHRYEPDRTYASSCQMTDTTASRISCELGEVGQVVEGDTALFNYDAVGNLVRADNRYARIRRTYYPNGALKIDSLKIRKVDTSQYGTWDYIYSSNPYQLSHNSPGWNEDFTSHVYVMQSQYDLNGRRTSLTYPSQLTACGVSCTSDTYQYNGAGQLSQITDGRGGTYQFKYSAGGALDTLIYPNSIKERRTYDADGNALSVDHVKSYTMQYDSLGHLIQTDGPTNDGTWGGNVVRTKFRYSSLGALVMADYNSLTTNNRWSEEPRTDAIGQQYLSRAWMNAGVPDTTRTTMDSEGRVQSTETKGYNNLYHSWTQHFADGSTRFVVREFPSSSRLAMFYGSNRFMRFSFSGTNAEENRYDALGRRIFSAISECFPWPACVAATQRFVWDGAQLVAELRARSSEAESDTSSGDVTSGNSQWTGGQFGRVWYVHAGGIDRPVGVIRLGGGTGWNGSSIPSVLTIYPHVNGRGLYEWGSTSAGDTMPMCACPVIAMPGASMTSALAPHPNFNAYQNQLKGWAGSLLVEQVGATGLAYRRNRFYDPASGRFTQVDPAGIAGGLGVYGFGGGDPINYGDPFGLFSIGRFFSGIGHFLSNVAHGMGFWSSTDENYECDGVGCNTGAIIGFFAGAPGRGIRYMGAAEAAEVSATGVIPAVNGEGAARIIHYTMDMGSILSGPQANTTYMLGSTPTHGCIFELCNVQNQVTPAGPVMPGATQGATNLPIVGVFPPFPLPGSQLPKPKNDCKPPLCAE